jgi:hypothetical protein
MTIPFATGKTISINQLLGVDITDVANNNVLQYNSTNGVWDNGGLDLSGQDINVDEIDCRVLRVSETADIVGRLANQGVASFVNDEFIFQNGVSDLGDTLYIDNVNKALALTGTNFGDAGSVITSNGAGNATTWNRPYFIKVKLLADYPLTGASGATTVLTMSAVDFGTGFDYNGTTDWANDEWTCPQTGVYRVSLQLGVQSTTADKTYYAGAILELTGATTSYIYRNESVLFSDDDADQIYLAGTTINKFEQGDELRLIIGWTVSSGTVKARGDSVEDKTFLIIERII